MPEPLVQYKIKAAKDAKLGSRAKKKTPRRSRVKVWILTILLLIALVFLSYQSILTGIGNHLISVDSPANADAIIVVGGSDGTQEIKAVELYRAGLSPRVLFIGGQAGWRTSQGYLMAKHARAIGLPAKAMAIMPSAGTLGESASWIKQRYINYGWRSLIVVASPFETLRVRRIFAEIYPPPIYKIKVVASEYTDFGPDNWWQTDVGIQTVIIEYSRLLADRLSSSGSGR